MEHKDLAWGLASNEICVLRFDSMTSTNADKIAESDILTLTDEYVPHALAAIEIIQAHPGMEGKPVFVIGHSLGGVIAPKVAAAVPDLSGVVLLAAATQPYYRCALWHIEYPASLKHNPSYATAQMVEDWTRWTALIDNPDFSISTPRGELPLGTAAAYWLDVRDYQLVKTLEEFMKKNESLRALIVQGRRHYLVTLRLILRFKDWKDGMCDSNAQEDKFEDEEKHKEKREREREKQQR